MNEELVIRDVENLKTTSQSHGERLDKVEKDTDGLSHSVDFLSKQLQSLIDTLKWLVRTIAGAVLVAAVIAVAKLL